MPLPALAGQPSGVDDMGIQISYHLMASPDLDQAVVTAPPGPVRALKDHPEPVASSDVIRRIFDDLSRLIDYLRLIETEVRPNGWLKQIPSLLRLVCKEALLLLDFIETRALQMEGLNEAARDALESTSYAINHELHGAFGGRLLEQSALEHTWLDRGKVEDACGLLHNCFRESVIVLARVFDPGPDFTHLFNDRQTRLEESLVLCKELSALTQLIRYAERRPGRGAIDIVIERLEWFRGGSLRYLMYKDWGPCERMIEEVKASRGTAEVGEVLHRAGCYLETLLGHVKMRAVLANHAFNQSDSHPASK